MFHQSPRNTNNLAHILDLVLGDQDTSSIQERSDVSLQQLNNNLSGLGDFHCFPRWSTFSLKSTKTVSSFNIFYFLLRPGVA